MCVHWLAAGPNGSNGRAPGMTPLAVAQVQAQAGIFIPLFLLIKFSLSNIANHLQVDKEKLEKHISEIVSATNSLIERIKVSHFISS